MNIRESNKITGLVTHGVLTQNFLTFSLRTPTFQVKSFLKLLFQWFFVYLFKEDFVNKKTECDLMIHAV